MLWYNMHTWIQRIKLLPWKTNHIKSWKFRRHIFEIIHIHIKKFGALYWQLHAQRLNIKPVIQSVPFTLPQSLFHFYTLNYIPQSNMQPNLFVLSSHRLSYILISSTFILFLTYCPHIPRLPHPSSRNFSTHWKNLCDLHIVSTLYLLIHTLYAALNTVHKL